MVVAEAREEVGLVALGLPVPRLDEAPSSFQPKPQLASVSYTGLPCRME